MKIISGKYRNNKIPVLKNSNYRPSTTKFREALFSILSSGKFYNQPAFYQKKVLDLFAGTGSLSFEAISRGAKTTTLIDKCKKHLDLAKKFAHTIGETKNIKFILADILKLSETTEQYDLIFIDPPYYKKIIEQTIINLINNNWLNHNAIITIETSKYDAITINPRLRVITEKLYSNNKLLILQYES